MNGPSFPTLLKSAREIIPYLHSCLNEVVSDELLTLEHNRQVKPGASLTAGFGSCSCFTLHLSFLQHWRNNNQIFNLVKI